MKIAFVYDAIYPWIKGGGEKRIYDIGKRLVNGGHNVHLFGVKWWKGPDMIENEGMVLHGVCKPMELYVDGRRSISEAILFSIRLFPHLAKERFDIIDVTAFPYFSVFTTKLISVMRITPMVITWHEVWGDYWYEYIGKYGLFGKIIEYLVSKLASKSITVSKMTKNNLQLLGVHTDNIHVIPNGIDLRMIDSIAPSADKCDVIFVGRLIKEKNVDILIEAIDDIRKTLSNIKCHIIGNGPEKERLVELIIEKDLVHTIKFFEFMEYNEVIARMKSSKMLILPSSREGFGMVVIEAFACGIPVITVRNGRNAASDLVSRETGFIVNLDMKELSNAIHTLIVKDDIREKMSESAINASKEYELDNIVRQLAHLYYHS